MGLVKAKAAEAFMATDIHLKNWSLTDLHCYYITKNKKITKRFDTAHYFIPMAGYFIPPGSNIGNYV